MSGASASTIPPAVRLTIDTTALSDAEESVGGAEPTKRLAYANCLLIRSAACAVTKRNAWAIVPLYPNELTPPAYAASAPGGAA